MKIYQEITVYMAKFDILGTKQEIIAYVTKLTDQNQRKVTGKYSLYGKGDRHMEA